MSHYRVDKSMIKNILIADDHEIVRNGIKMMIRSTGQTYSLFEAATCKDTLRILSSQAIDYIVLDLFLVDGSTFPIVDEIITHYPGTGILIYTMNSEKIYGRRLIQKGVRGFVCKQASISELEKAIRILLNGDFYISPELKADLSGNGSADTERNLIDALSDRELEVVEYLILGIGIKEISNQMNIDATTVSTYRRRACEKLKVTSNIELKDKFLLFKMGT